MKFEHERILFEFRISRKPLSALDEGTICLNTEDGLHHMRLNYLRRCEEEQAEARRCFEFIFVYSWNLIHSEIEKGNDVTVRVTIMEMSIHEFMNRFTPML